MRGICTTAFLASLMAAGCTDEFAPKQPPVGDGGSSDGGGGGGNDLSGPLPPGDGGSKPPVRSCATTLSFVPGGAPKSVAVAGEFNNWSATKNPLTGPDAAGSYSANLTLQPGAYAYKFVVTDGSGTQSWLLDPSTPYTKYVGGVENSVVEVDDCKAPRIDFVKLDRNGQSAHFEAQYVDGSGGSGWDQTMLQVLLDGAPAPGLSLTADGHITADASGLGKDKHRFTVRAADNEGHHAVDLLVPFWIEDQPFDSRDGILYFAFTDRFQDGNPGDTQPAGDVDPRANYQGGDFAGIQMAIESGYFDSLGVRTIWISPPNANPDHSETGTGNHLYTGYHGYWPTDGRATQKRFGDLTALQSMIKAAHSRGIRVIADAVLNHVHTDNPYWTNHPDWFNPLTINGQQCVCGTGPTDGCGDWNSNQPNGNHGLVPRQTCWFEPYLADLDYENFDALTAMVDDALYWADQADLDGFRVDAVKHFPTIVTRRLRAKLRDRFEHAQPLFYLVGETFDGDRGLIDSYVGPNQLHAQFDFPLYFNVRDTLATYATSLRNLESAAAASDAAFGSAPMSQFLGNHDVARFLSTAVASGATGALTGDPQGQAWSAPPPVPADDSAYQKLRLALTFVETQPGVPLVYYGDEYGQPGAGDPDNRRFMKWSGYSQWEQDTLTVAQKLGAARKELEALRKGDRRTLFIDDNFYVYSRTTGSNVAVVVINRQWSAVTQNVPVPSGVPLPDGTKLTDRLYGGTVTVAGGNLPLNVPAHSSMVLAP